MINNKLLTVEEFDDLSLSFELKVPAKIYLNPTEESLHFEQVPVSYTELETSIDMTISMQQTKNDRSVEDLSINQRKCVFSDEVELKHFKNEPYTLAGCLRDCKVDLALDFCGCLPPFHPPKHNNLTFCGVRDLRCLKDQMITDVSKCAHCELSCDFTTFALENIKTE